MTQLRVITRAIIKNEGQVLLARNKDADFWYPPGGGWEFEDESIKDSVRREVMEETGYSVNVDKLLWVREFREPEKDKVSLETFWQTSVADDNQQTVEGVTKHLDADKNGAVEECQWFATHDLGTIKILPKFLKQHINDADIQRADAFIDG